MQNRPVQPRLFIQEKAAYFGVLPNNQDNEQFFLAALQGDIGKIQRIAKQQRNNGKSSAAHWYLLLAQLNGTADGKKHPAIATMESFTSSPTCHPTVLACLGLCYARGYGVTRDTAMAEKYFDLGAQKNNASCLFHLGMLRLNKPSDIRRQLEAAKFIGHAAKRLLATPNLLALAQQQEINFEPAIHLIQPMIENHLTGLALLDFLAIITDCYLIALKLANLDISEQIAFNKGDQAELLMRLKTILADVCDPDTAFQSLTNDELNRAIIESDIHPACALIHHYEKLSVTSNQFIQQIHKNIKTLKSLADAHAEMLPKKSALTFWQQGWFKAFHLALGNRNTNLFELYRDILNKLPSEQPRDNVDFHYASCHLLLRGLSNPVPEYLFKHLPEEERQSLYNPAPSFFSVTPSAQPGTTPSPACAPRGLTL